MRIRINELRKPIRRELWVLLEDSGKSSDPAYGEFGISEPAGDSDISEDSKSDQMRDLEQEIQDETPSGPVGTSPGDQAGIKTKQIQLTMATAKLDDLATS